MMIMVPTLHRYIKYRRLVEELVNYHLTGTGASKKDAVDVLAKKFRFWMTTLAFPLYNHHHPYLPYK